MAHGITLVMREITPTFSFIPSHEWKVHHIERTFGLGSKPRFKVSYRGYRRNMWREMRRMDARRLRHQAKQLPPSVA